MSAFADPPGRASRAGSLMLFWMGLLVVILFGSDLLTRIHTWRSSIALSALPVEPLEGFGGWQDIWPDGPVGITTIAVGAAGLLLGLRVTLAVVELVLDALRRGGGARLGLAAVYTAMYLLLPVVERVVISWLLELPSFERLMYGAVLLVPTFAVRLAMFVAPLVIVYLAVTGAADLGVAGQGRSGTRGVLGAVLGRVDGR